jgi:hypothetical protein
MDLSKLTTSDKVVAGSGLLLFIFSFFPWYGVDGFDGGRNGWDYFFWGILPVLIGLIMLAVVAIKAFSPDTKLPDLPMPWGQVMLIGGVIAAILVVLKLLIGDDVLGFDLDRKFGLILSALSAIGLAVGGYLKFQEGDTTTASGGGSGTAPF